MAITEQGVGVSLRPLQQSQPMVYTPANQPGGILSAPLFGAGGSRWFSSEYQTQGRTLRIAFPRRLWTSASDPTDPGLVYGVHWRLGFVLGAEGSSGVVQTSYRNGSVLQPGANVNDARLLVDPSVFFPTPDVVETISLQPQASTSFLTLALVIASLQTQTYCLPVDLAVCATWTG